MIKNTEIIQSSHDLIPHLKNLFAITRIRNSPYIGEELNQLESLDTCIQFLIMNAESTVLQKPTHTVKNNPPTTHKPTLKINPATTHNPTLDPPSMTASSTPQIAKSTIEPPPKKLIKR